MANKKKSVGEGGKDFRADLRKDRDGGEMKKSTIVNYIPKRDVRRVIRTDVYRLKKNNKLIAFIIKMLTKWKVIEEDYEDKINITRVEINHEKVMYLIRDLLDQIYYKEGKSASLLIIGYDKMRQLDIETYDEMRFNMPIVLNGREGRKVFGLDIILNPMIDGLVLV